MWETDCETRWKRLTERLTERDWLNKREWQGGRERVTGRKRLTEKERERVGVRLIEKDWLRHDEWETDIRERQTEKCRQIERLTEFETKSEPDSESYWLRKRERLTNRDSDWERERLMERKTYGQGERLTEIETEWDREADWEKMTGLYRDWLRKQD